MAIWGLGSMHLYTFSENLDMDSPNLGQLPFFWGPSFIRRGRILFKWTQKGPRF